MKTNVLSRYGQLFVILGVMCSRCRGAIGQSSSCGKGWIKYKDHCYLLVQSNVTWTEARSKCLHESSELTSIHSLEENKFLSSRLPNNSEFWIGLESWKLRKDNHWTDKSSLNFLGFSVRSEDVLKFSTGFCVYIEQKSGYWKTSDCRFISISGYICKRPAYNGPANTQSQFQVACTKERPSSCYTLYTESRPWEEAQRLCREQNQNLVTITDRQTLLYLKSIVELNVISIWTGISLHNGSFKWDTGDIQDPYSWVSTDKEAVSGCVALQSFVWKAHNCNNSLPFLCENRQDTAMNKHDIAMNKQDTAMNKQDTAMKKQDTAMNWLDTSMNRQNTATNRPDTSINRQDTSMNWPDTSIDDTMSRMSLATLTRFVVSPRLVPGLHSQTISRPKQILDETDNDKFVVGKSRPKSLVIREAANDVQCPYGWIQNMDKCYKVMKKGEDWHGARKYCENLGANLPSIHSSLENGFLTSIAIRYGVYEIWIGLHDSSQETVFEWTDGTSYNFQRWLAGEPNNYRASEDCVELYHGNWNDDNCNYVRPYVCVKKLVPITAVTNSSAGPATRPGVTTLLAITTTVHVVSKSSIPATISEVSKSSLPATTSEVSKTSLPATTSEVSKSSLPATTSEVSKSLLPATTSEVSKTSLPATTSEVSKSSLPATTSDVSKSSLPTTTSKASKSAILTKTSGVSKSTSIPTTALRIPKSTSIPTTALRIPKSTSIPTTALRIPKSTSIPTTSSGASKSSSSPAKCPEKFQKFHTSCYLVVSQLETWDEARSSCQACGADLAKTEHVLQLSKMTLLLADYGVIKPAWIGIKQMDGSRIEWTDRTPVRRFFWANNKTSIDSANRSTPFCVSLSDSKWRRTDCREKRAYICQIKLVRPTAKVPLLNNETLCKDGKSVQHGDYCYLMTKHQVSWPEADHVCKHRGMQLVSIHSNSQTNFLVNYTQHTSETLYYWIGLVSYRNGSFHWSDGSSITYDNWAEDPREDSEEKCAVLDSNKGRWYPTNCRTESHGYICSSHSRDVKILPSSEPVRPYISGGVRAAIVVAALSACGLLVFAVVFLLRRRRRRQPSDEELLNSTAFENALYVSSRTEDEQTTFTANV